MFAQELGVANVIHQDQDADLEPILVVVIVFFFFFFFFFYFIIFFKLHRFRFIFTHLSQELFQQFFVV